MAREKVIDTGDKAVETSKATQAEATDKTFTPRLLDSVNDISSLSAQKEQSALTKSEDSNSKGKKAASEDKGDPHQKN